MLPKVVSTTVTRTICGVLTHFLFASSIFFSVNRCTQSQVINRVYIFLSSLQVIITITIAITVTIAITMTPTITTVTMKITRTITIKIRTRET